MALGYGDDTGGGGYSVTSTPLGPTDGVTQEEYSRYQAQVSGGSPSGTRDYGYSTGGSNFFGEESGGTDSTSGDGGQGVGDFLESIADDLVGVLETFIESTLQGAARGAKSSSQGAESGAEAGQELAFGNIPPLVYIGAIGLLAYLVLS